MPVSNGVIIHCRWCMVIGALLNCSLEYGTCTTCNLCKAGSILHLQAILGTRLLSRRTQENYSPTPKLGLTSKLGRHR